MAQRFVLIDAHSIIFRSYFAFIRNPLRNARGVNTSGVFGFMNMIQKIKKNLASEYMGLVFDAPGETFRDRAFKEYKATRPPAPADIPFQIEKVKAITETMGMPRFEIAGYEADDVLATLALKLKARGDVYIVTSDKDLLQMVGDHIYVYDAYQDLVYDRDRVQAKFGVAPEQIPAYLALTGDTIDNVPGVPGIGPKRALEIVKKYRDFDDALKNDARLQAHREKALLSRRLIELATDVPLEIDIEALRVREPDIERLMPILIDLEFHSHIKEFSNAARTGCQVQPLPDPGALAGNEVLGVALREGQLYLSPDPDRVYAAPLEAAAVVLASASTVIAGHDVKKICRAAAVAGPLFDLQVAAWLLDPNRRANSFEDICLHNLNILPDQAPGTEAAYSRRLYPVMQAKLAAQEMLELYDNIEAPLIKVLARMEERGIGLDIVYLQELDVTIEEKLRTSEKAIFTLVGHAFNLNSPKQLAQVLFEELGLKPAKRRKTHYSTDYEVLTQLSLVHEVPREILTYRELAKMKSTYLEPLIMQSRDGRIHTTFNQTATATGRLSSSNPNIQNIPVRRDLGKEIRKGFVAEEGYTLLSADYSQIELRLLAHFSGDQTLIRAFERGEDIHRHTASVVFGIPENKVSEAQRRMAKVVNYGLIYGMSDYGLAQRFDIVQEEAAQFIESYYTLYPGVAAWRDAAVRSAEEKGYAETLLKRRRPLPDLHARNHALREFSRRAAVNTPIQGTAADLIKIAMIDIEGRLTQAGFKQGLLLSIHDELLFEIELERVREASTLIKDAMENALHINVPVEVFIGLGRNWAEAH